MKLVRTDANTLWPGASPVVVEALPAIVSAIAVVVGLLLWAANRTTSLSINWGTVDVFYFGLILCSFAGGLGWVAIRKRSVGWSLFGVRAALSFVMFWLAAAAFLAPGSGLPDGGQLDYDWRPLVGFAVLFAGGATGSIGSAIAISRVGRVSG